MVGGAPSHLSCAAAIVVRRAVDLGLASRVGRMRLASCYEPAMTGMTDTSISTELMSPTNCGRSAMTEHAGGWRALRRCGTSSGRCCAAAACRRVRPACVPAYVGRVSSSSGVSESRNGSAACGDCACQAPTSRPSRAWSRACQSRRCCVQAGTTILSLAHLHPEELLLAGEVADDPAQAVHGGRRRMASSGGTPSRQRRNSLRAKRSWVTSG